MCPKVPLMPGQQQNICKSSDEGRKGEDLWEGKKFPAFLHHKEEVAQYVVSKGVDVALLMVLGSEQPWGSYDGC